MINDFFAQLVIGHLIGDYVLQNKWMALNKSKNSEICWLHCMIYATVVSATTWHAFGGVNVIYWWQFVCYSHFIVDRFSLAELWLQFINGRSLAQFMKNGKYDVPVELDDNKAANYHALSGGFTALVYAVCDNTFHLASMYYFFKIFA